MTDYRTHFLGGLGFGVDDFQVAALDALDTGATVLVSAPTGSGKTLVANYAIGLELARQRRSFYTTPLKALSNQKFHELGRLYGRDAVGLLTGDVSVNRDAAVIVMTTEVLRNMLLTDSDQLANLGLVVLDEVHYLQDPFRGGVWEEVIILTPPEVRFVALSATIGNAPALGEWLSEVRGATEVVVETERPIALRQHVALVRRGQTQAEVIELIDEGHLAEGARRVDNALRATRKFRPGPRWHGPRSSAPPPPFRAPRRSELMRALEVEDLLPVIVFIFSRAACDDAVHQLRRDGLRFTSREESRRIEAIAEARLAEFSDEDLAALEYAEFLDALCRGITSHHAGMVPAFREIVEACFEEDLLAVVFATETLALGINMPARTVAIERFSKYSDAGRQFLTSAEYAQMTGRAGRRGLDEEGHAVVCFATDLSLADVARVALAPPAELHSSFRPTYNLTANLVDHFDRETALEVVRRSYAQFENVRRPAGRRRPLDEMLAARHAVLGDLGYAEGWRLTEAGQLLRSLYHECDLLIAETIAAGLLDGLEAAPLAGVLSCFSYEGRRAPRAHSAAKGVASKNRRSTQDRLGPVRRTAMADRLREVQALYAATCAAEDHHGVPHAKEPDGAFATVIAAWARGVALGPVLDLADAELGHTSPGDFVRQAKQVADLCEQIARLGHLGALARVAGEAREALVRSVVAGSASVHPHRDDGL